MCVGDSFLSFGQFSSKTSLKVLCSTLTWDSSPSHVHRLQGLISPWYPTLTTMSTHTLYQLSYIPSPQITICWLHQLMSGPPERKINFPKCIYIHFLNISKSAFNFLVRSWSHCQVSMEIIKKHLEAGSIPWGIKMFFYFFWMWCYFYFSFVQKDWMS